MTPAYRIGVLTLALTFTAVSAACSGTDGESADDGPPKILPHRSPANLGEFYPPKKDAANPGDASRIPIEWTLLLQSTGGQALKLDKACIIAEGEMKGDKETEHFTLEGPEPKTVESGDEGALRLTYDRQKPNDGDDIDNISLIVQSNADNFPTLVVPVCARVVKDGKDKQAIACDAPVEAVPKGESKSGLCK